MTARPMPEFKPLPDQPRAAPLLGGAVDASDPSWAFRQHRSMAEIMSKDATAPDEAESRLQRVIPGSIAHYLRPAPVERCPVEETLALAGLDPIKLETDR